MESERASGEVHEGEGFKPNQEFLKIMLEMGIASHVAEVALRETNNSSLDLAIVRALEIVENSSDEENWDPIKDYKMTFVVNSSLELSPGKLASQVAHGALTLYRQLVESPAYTVDVSNWIESGETKIVLKGDDEESLLALSREAAHAGLQYTIIQDAGLTECTPGSLTVLAIFGSVDKVNTVTKKLSLL